MAIRARTRALRFPDVPKLELDELIDQLVERAQRRQAGPGPAARAAARHRDGHRRPRRSRSCCATSSSRPASSPARSTARSGVIGHDGGLEQFIHVGIDDDTAARIGNLPQGKGLLGALITDPRPIRLRAHDRRRPLDRLPAATTRRWTPSSASRSTCATRCSATSTWPTARSGEFSAEDEELVIALALAAGTAISNARLYPGVAPAAALARGVASRSASQMLASVRRGPAAHGRPPGHRHRRRRPRQRRPGDVPDGTASSSRWRSARTPTNSIGQRFPLDGPSPARWSRRASRCCSRAPATPAGAPSHLASVIDAGPLMVLPLRGTRRRLAAC